MVEVPKPERHAADNRCMTELLKTSVKPSTQLLLVVRVGKRYAIAEQELVLLVHKAREKPACYLVVGSERVGNSLPGHGVENPLITSYRHVLALVVHLGVTCHEKNRASFVLVNSSEHETHTSRLISADIKQILICLHRIAYPPRRI